MNDESKPQDKITTATEPLTFGPFYDKLFCHDKDGKPKDFTVASKEDLSDCIAYCIYQAKKKKFSIDHGYCLTSNEVKIFRDSQDIETYRALADLLIGDILDKYANLHNKEFVLEPLKDEIRRATGFRQTFLQGLISGIVIPIVIFVLIEYGQYVPKYYDYLSDFFTDSPSIVEQSVSPPPEDSEPVQNLPTQ